MAGETLFAQIIRDTSSTSKRDSTPLAVCRLCGLLRDQTRAFLNEERFVTQCSYLKTYGVNPANCHLTFTCRSRCLPRGDTTIAARSWRVW
jgi:hypothetical protein